MEGSDQGQLERLSGLRDSTTGFTVGIHPPRRFSNLTDGLPVGFRDQQLTPGSDDADTDPSKASLLKEEERSDFLDLDTPRRTPPDSRTHHWDFVATRPYAQGVTQHSPGSPKAHPGSRTRATPVPRRGSTAFPGCAARSWARVCNAVGVGIVGGVVRSQGALRDPGLCCGTPLAYDTPSKPGGVERGLSIFLRTREPTMAHPSNPLSSRPNDRSAATSRNGGHDGSARFSRVA